VRGGQPTSTVLGKRLAVRLSVNVGTFRPNPLSISSADTSLEPAVAGRTCLPTATSRNTLREKSADAHAHAAGAGAGADAATADAGADAAGAAGAGLVADHVPALAPSARARVAASAASTASATPQTLLLVPRPQTDAAAGYQASSGSDTDDPDAADDADRCRRRRCCRQRRTDRRTVLGSNGLRERLSGKCALWWIAAISCLTFCPRALPVPHDRLDLSGDDRSPTCLRVR
jgi:hypothetical protein